MAIEKKVRVELSGKWDKGETAYLTQIDNSEYELNIQDCTISITKEGLTRLAQVLTEFSQELGKI